MSLKSLLISKIQEEGPLTLADYMRQCLYHPEYGYYIKKNPLGREGDFITAPEISSLFGFVVRTAIESLVTEYNLQDGLIVECGGGTGFLMEDILSAPFSPRKAHMVEISPVLQNKQQDRLKGFEVEWHTTVSELLSTIKNQPLIVVGNEFLDAFPIHQYVFTKEGWREKAIGLSASEEFIFQEIPTSFTANASYGPAKVGDIVEESQDVLDYLDPLFTHIKSYGGAGIFIDYGYSVPAYGDTFQGIKTHQYEDPLKNPGNVDLTAHVNFQRVQEYAENRGLQALPLLTQKEFLEHYGIDFYLSKILPHVEAADQQSFMASIQRLMDPKGMGSLFKVIIVVQGL